jgi:hypothetical protein
MLTGHGKVSGTPVGGSAVGATRAHEHLAHVALGEETPLH